MADHVKKAREALGTIMAEFAPAKDHAVGAGREFLLALRSVVDAEINLLDRATTKKPCCGAEPPAAPSKCDTGCDCEGSA